MPYVLCPHFRTANINGLYELYEDVLAAEKQGCKDTDPQNVF